MRPVDAIPGTGAEEGQTDLCHGKAPLPEDRTAAGCLSRPPAAHRSVGGYPAVVYRDVLTSWRKASSCRRCRSHRMPHRGSVRHGTRHSGTVPRHYTVYPVSFLHLRALCRPLLPAPWLVTRSTQQPVSSFWNVTRLDVLKSRATARCVALASRTLRGEDASATRSGPGRRWSRRPRVPRPGSHRAGLATAALQPLGSSADGADTVPALPQLA